MGHQGSSATYPSALDKITLNHLQNHGGFPHTPADCPVELRTVRDYEENYNENLSDDRNNFNMNENGKHHCSVVGPMIFPLTDVNQVVPATLHILLGVVLLIYNLLLEECRKIDKEEGVELMVEERQKIQDEWELASLRLVDAEKTLRERGENVVIMMNRSHHHDAVSIGDVAENVKLSKVSDAARKSRKRKTEIEKCHSASCFVTRHDVNVEWVQCDKCDHWYHTMCEVLTPLEEVALANLQYKCLDCRGVADRTKAFNDAIMTLIDEEDILNAEVVNVRTTCDDMQARYQEVIGKREKELNDALESIKVVRQAYHGNAMVGNHCVLVLKNYMTLTSVIRDKEGRFDFFNEILEIFNQIMSLVMARRFLSEEEVDKLEDNCNTFGRKFPIYFPERNITRKIHELVFNVPRFVKRYRTIGMLSEQEGESKHASVSHAEKMHLLLQREELRAMTDKSVMRPSKPRLCNVCKDNKKRVYLRAGNDGKRHCPICDLHFFK